MRRVLLFVVLFGLGLGALLYVRAKLARHEPAPAGRSIPRKPDGEFTKIPLDKAPGDPAQQGVEINLQGQLDITQFQGEGGLKKPVRTLHADDVQSLGGSLYVLRGMVVRFLDPETGVTTAELASPKTRLKIDVVDGKASFGEGEKAVLSDVEAKLLARAPVTPIVLRVPLLEWRIGANRWVSEQAVEIAGSGLTARGDSLDVDLETGQLVLPRAGSIVLDVSGGSQATLAARGEGPIAIRRVAGEAAGAGDVEIVAAEGARFSASGADPLTLDAREIRIRARGGTSEKKELELESAVAEGDVVAESRGDTFRAEKASFLVTPQGRLRRAELEGGVTLATGEGAVRGKTATVEFADTGRPASAHVVGDVVLEHGEDRFRAQSAEFTFGPSGRIANATLVGEPTGTVSVGRYLPETERELRTARAELSGAGPLVLRFDAATSLSLAGPGTLTVPEAGLEIRAERSLSGEAFADHRSGNLEAVGAVHLAWGGYALESERVELRATPAPPPAQPGETQVDATSSGATSVRRQGEGGENLDFVASDGLEARSIGKHLVVPSARGVEITTSGTASGLGAMRARAGVVRDFDWDARTFSAEGDVLYEGAGGSGSADRAISYGPEDIELIGSAAQVARYTRKAGAAESRFDEATVEGRKIRARANALHATDDVRLELVAAEATYELQGGDVEIEFEQPAGPGSDAAQPYEARAHTLVRASARTAEGESTLACDRLRIAGTTKGSAGKGSAQSGPEGQGSGPAVAASDVRAEGSVVIDWRAQGGIAGEGDLFTLDPQGHGRLSASEGKRVRAHGRLTPHSAPYVLDADWVDFDRQRLEARGVRLELAPPKASAPAPEASPSIEAGKPRGPSVQSSDAQELAAVPVPAQGMLLTEVSADHLRATPTELLLEGSAHVAGRTEQGEAWSVRAGAIRLRGNFGDAQELTRTAIERIQAWDGFDATLGVRGRARGQRLESKGDTIRLEGDPATLSSDQIALQSVWIEYDAKNMLLSTDKGTLRPSGEEKEPWTITYESLKPFEREDKTILALRNPVFRKADVEMRALWMLFWLDREEWRRSGGKMVSETATGPDLRVQAPEPSAPPPPDEKKQRQRDVSERVGGILGAIQRFRGNPFAKVLSEVYVEGNIELTEGGERRARAGAIYLDVLQGHGWVRDADVLEEVPLRGKKQQMRLRAEWMRVSQDLSLRADKATLSFCGHDDPHYVVETGDLRLRPNAKGGLFDYDVSATKNALRFENGWAIPLPPLVYGEDEEGNPIIENISVGQSAKFGASIGATFNVGLGKVGRGLGNFFERFLSLPRASVKGNWTFHGNYLGSRGVLLGTGLELRSGDDFSLDAEFSVIPDHGEDKGVIRVPEDDRDTLRTWTRGRGRYTGSKEEWVDLAFSYQSDPGVQAEFFERDYFRYEQKDNYAHWRKADDAWFFDASALVRLEDRSQIEELPRAGVFHGRTPFTQLFGLDLVYTGVLDADYLQRRERQPPYLPAPGDFVPPTPGNIYPDYQPFADGLGDRSVARIDTDQRIEAPISLDFAGLRATPWVSVRATAWDQGVDPDTSPARAGLIAGFDLSTVVWRRFGNGFLHTLTPFVGVRADLASEETDGVPVVFDETELPIEGRYLDVGLRSRLWNPATRSRFDIEVRTTHGSDLPAGIPTGFQPLSVLADLLTWVGDVPLGVTQDGRYDVEGGTNTLYSRTYLGVRPAHMLDIELGYNRGVDAQTGILLYEAATAGARLRASKKWELEVSETISLIDDEGLASSVLLRRLGHDFVTEIEVGQTAGEGARFSINLTPLLTYKPGGLGLLDRWIGQ